MQYEFTNSMTEISGFGGEYEEACRNMLIAGCKWLEANPEANPMFKGFRGVYGVIESDNDDAKSLSNAVVHGAGQYGPSGAMHQAVISSLLFIKAKGWDEYVKLKTHPEGELGILREKLQEKTASYDKLWKRFSKLENDLEKRNRIIAEKVLGWNEYSIDMNDQQRVYAPNQKTAGMLCLGDRLMKFVDQAIDNMPERE